jgi:hypothetical protein
LIAGVHAALVGSGDEKANPTITSLIGSAVMSEERGNTDLFARDVAGAPM